MRHLGDITKINGADIPPVDIITFGSPCQDLSVAGKREGLSGERSGLFMEAVRIIKEMRSATKQLSMYGSNVVERSFPRIAIWENVCGAFSSNHGEDFRCVLEELARIENPEVSIPKPEKWGGDGWIELPHGCITWRTHDAQYWGVPQRRKRISLVVDFREEPRPEIQFIAESVSRNPKPSEEKRKETTRTTEDSFGETSQTLTFRERAGKRGGGKGILIQWERSGSLSTSNNQVVFDGSGGNTPIVLSESPIFTIGHDIRSSKFTDDEITDPLTATDYKDPIKICQKNARRLTPTECERLQGFPDFWTKIGEWKDSKGKTHKESDAQRYKALGNSLALPYWIWLAQRVSTSLGNKDLTMGSLFDGIGGFPLAFSKSGVKPIWASEIEEFPIAVTKRRFPDEEK